MQDGRSILAGESISWKYIVTNDGDVTLTSIAVTDVPLGTICTIPSLVAGASTTCTKTGTAASGSYSNTGTASTTYTDLDGNAATRTASDGSSSFGANPQIDIVKKTVGSDGSEGDNVFILINGAVTWKYYVTNTYPGA